MKKDQKGKKKLAAHLFASHEESRIGISTNNNTGAVNFRNEILEGVIDPLSSVVMILRMEGRMRVRDPRSIFFLKISRSVRSSRESFLITGSTVGNDDERALSYRRHWREERRIGSKVTKLGAR